MRCMTCCIMCIFGLTQRCEVKCVSQHLVRPASGGLYQQQGLRSPAVATWCFNASHAPGRYRLHIVGEVTVAVRHCLLALPGVGKGDVRRVVSHYQALAQCDRYIRRLPGVVREAADDTAGAAKAIADTGCRHGLQSCPPAAIAAGCLVLVDACLFHGMVAPCGVLRFMRFGISQRAICQEQLERHTSSAAQPQPAYIMFITLSAGTRRRSRARARASCTAWRCLTATSRTARAT